MKSDVANYVSRCLTCQQVKAKHQKLTDLLQQLEIPKWKWERITINFVVGLSHSLKGYDSIWVIMDWLMKAAHFILVKTTYSVAKYARFYKD